MYREWKKIEFLKEYYIWIWEQQHWEVDQEIDGKEGVREDGRIVGGEGWQEKVHNRGTEEAPENGKESSNSAHASGMKGMKYLWIPRRIQNWTVFNLQLCDDVIFCKLGTLKWRYARFLETLGIGGDGNISRDSTSYATQSWSQIHSFAGTPGTEDDDWNRRWFWLVCVWWNCGWWWWQVMTNFMWCKSHLIIICLETMLGATQDVGLE